MSWFGMRLSIFLPVLSAAVLFAAAPSSGRTVVVNGQTYALLEPNVIDAGYGTEAVSYTQPQAIYEHAFYTPAANYQQNGYRCVGLMSVSFAGRVRHLHRGTFCTAGT